MRKLLWLIFLAAVCFVTGSAVYTGFYKNSLDYKISRLLQGKDVHAGVAVVEDGRYWAAGNIRQPLMSVFKFFIALKVFDKMRTEQTKLQTKITVQKNMVEKTLYSPMLKKYRHFPADISLAELLEYMLAQSDNNAADILLEYAGGAEEVEEYLKTIGFKEITIAVNEREMNADIEKQLLNKAYPLDVARVMQKAFDGNILPSYQKDFLKQVLLKTTTGNDKIKAGLPPQTVIGHKTGSSSRRENGVKIADNDAGFVVLPDGRKYYIVVMLSDSKMSDEKNAGLIAGISSVVYAHLLSGVK